MFIDKIKSKQTGILLYGITPPKSSTPEEKVAEIANRTLARILPLDIDALIVYDVQDESARTSEERPFPFISSLDPFDFAKQHLTELKLPKIIYRPAGKFSKEELNKWLSDLSSSNCYPVFVGLPSPDVEVKTSLPEAYKLWQKHADNSVIGAITIPERHATLHDEDKRILDKTACGVSFFVSQCVFDLELSKKMVQDLYTTCKRENRDIPTIIFTLTACGSAKTLHFMDWLGIHIPGPLREELVASENMLEKSVDVCLTIADQLTNFCSGLGVSFGFNIESVAIRKEEIEASIQMLNQIASMLKSKNLR